ncbi:MAG: nitrous oxide-stimulated promoter family protein [Betaproteobacteria bacterium]|nr:nitrous oxide-stimulated promoter family protein [Betaproteobacteria bacterium]
MQSSGARRNGIRRKRELRTIQVMIRMYCRRHHADSGVRLCHECAALFDYAMRRLELCVFGDAKPTCANCTVHCYSAEKREQIREIMKWAGPRMLFRYPLLAVFHLLDGRRPAPRLPAKQARHSGRDPHSSRSGNH